MMTPLGRSTTSTTTRKNETSKPSSASLYLGRRIVLWTRISVLTPRIGHGLLVGSATTNEESWVRSFQITTTDDTTSQVKGRDEGVLTFVLSSSNTSSWATTRCHHLGEVDLVFFVLLVLSGFLGCFSLFFFFFLTSDLPPVTMNTGSFIKKQ